MNQVAKKCGVKSFDKFHNAGYKGLYNGETANDIAKRKKLRYREDILDNIFNNNVDDETFEKYLLGYIFNNKSSCQCFDNSYFNSDNDLPQGSKYKNFYKYC